MTPRHPTQIPNTRVLAPAVEEAIADGMSIHYVVAFLTGAIRDGWTEQQTAHQLSSNVATHLARVEAHR